MASCSLSRSRNVPPVPSQSERPSSGAWFGSLIQWLAALLALAWPKAFVSHAGGRAFAGPESGHGWRAPGLMSFAAAALVLLGASTAAAAREVPPLAGRVNDTAALLTQAERQRIEQKLAKYEADSGHQFAVLTIDTLDSDSLEEFSIRVVEAWKLGKKKVDDGLLLLVVRDDRKIRIEVGYGLEGEIPDAIAARITRDTLKPAFRAGRYGEGIEAAIDALIRATGREPAGGSAPVQRPVRGQPQGFPFPLVFIGLLILLPLLLSKLNSSAGGGRRYRGGGGGVWPGGGFGG
ncbi:MAG TPA: TPM domain-containing protein, partial [Polyangiaceae bacterium]|nr:TPM domain-containing protein [Polyangiaceae bacterium]